jgi:hypothetical protein
MRTLAIVFAILIGAGAVTSAILLQPTGFEQCVRIISSDIERQDPSLTLDPRDVEAQAARLCSGAVAASE